VNSAAVAQQGSSLGLQQRQTPQLLYHGKGLLRCLYCSRRLLLPQQADWLAHKSMDEPFCVHCVQVAQLRMDLQQQGTLQHFNGFVGFLSFVCQCVALCCKFELLSGIYAYHTAGSKQTVPDALW